MAPPADRNAGETRTSLRRCAGHQESQRSRRWRPVPRLCA